MFSVKGKTAVVTGATGVLCGAMARFLAEAGANVVLVGRREERGQAVEKQIREAGGQATFVRADVLVRDDMERVRDAAIAAYGRIDILINGAGGNRPGATTNEEQRFFDLPAGEIEQVVNLNLMGAVLPSQVMGEVFAEQQQGCIINISSMVAQQPITRVIGYSAAKAGLDNFTQWLAVHMAQEYSAAIRVNAIAPGFFIGEQNYYLLVDKETGQPTQRGRTIIDHTPMGRYGEPEDLMGTLLWLVSDGAKFVTGTVVPVDGGFSAFGGV